MKVLVVQCFGECIWIGGLAWECGKCVFDAGIVGVVGVVEGGRLRWISHKHSLILWYLLP